MRRRAYSSGMLHGGLDLSRRYIVSELAPECRRDHRHRPAAERAEPALDEVDRVERDDVRAGRVRPLPQRPRQVGVDDRVELFQRSGVGKDDVSELLPVAPNTSPKASVIAPRSAASLRSCS